MIKLQFVSIWLASLLVLLIGWLDYITGYELGFFVFYFLPLALVAWYSGKKSAIVASFFATAIWLIADSFSGHVYSNQFIIYWNSLIRLVTFAIVSFLLAHLKGKFNQEVLLNKELAISMSEVKKLSGFLPICASCKKIRNDEGYWEQIEVYIRDHSDAQFSHGICPDCAKKLYPEFYHEKKHDLNNA